jgi:dolichol-phosphate mannosyltransferase
MSDPLPPPKDQLNYDTAPWHVPTFEVYELDSKRNDYCVCVFVINEGDRLKRQLYRMRPLSSLVDIVIADGGSTDGSTNDDELKLENVNTLLIKTGEGKLGSQMRMAFAWALRRGYRGVVVVDGNNKDSVEDVPKFIERLRNGVDHIQGSRFIPGGRHEGTPISRLLGLKLLHAPLIRLASGFKYTDTTNGFRAYSSRLLSDPALAVFRDEFVGYELHYYLACKAPKLGFLCEEIAVTRIYPQKGKIPTKISPIKGNLQVIKRLFDVVFGKYDVKST